LRVAFIGTRGVPARYGGFETAAEEIGSRLVSLGYDVLVYSRDEAAPASHNGMRVVYLPTLRTKFTDTLIHGALSACHAIINRPDVAIVFNVANAPAAALLRLSRIPHAVHVDGLEWKRAKWSGLGRLFFLVCERITVWTAQAVIADSRAIEAYYQRRYGRDTTYIAYGAPRPMAVALARLAEHFLAPGEYHLVVARFEPENNLVPIIQGFVGSSARLPLVVVGGGPYSKRYTADVHAAAANDPRVKFLGSVWDQEMLDALYAGSCSYLHGHSVGGTNPSLLRAAGLGAPCVAFDVPFNREVLGDMAWFFSKPSDLTCCVDEIERDPQDTRQRALITQVRVHANYDWQEVVSRYRLLCDDLVGFRRRRRI